MATPKKSEKSSITIPLSYPFEDPLYHANDRNCETPRLGISATSSQHFPPKFEKIGLCCVTTAPIWPRIPHFYFKHPILYFQVVFNAICISHQWKIHTKPILGTSVIFCYSVDQWHRCFPGLNPDHWDRKPLHSPERDHRDPWRFPVSSVSRQTQAENLRKALESAFEPLFS